jgi:hypothetical protein
MLLSDALCKYTPIHLKPSRRSMTAFTSASSHQGNRQHSALEDEQDSKDTAGHTRRAAGLPSSLGCGWATWLHTSRIRTPAITRSAPCCHARRLVDKQPAMVHTADCRASHTVIGVSQGQGYAFSLNLIRSLGLWSPQATFPSDVQKVRLAVWLKAQLPY